MRQKRDGFPSIFRDKTGEKVQALLTQEGTVAFRLARHRLSKLADVEEEMVKSSDVVEYLARGDRETRKYLRDNPMK